MTTIFDFTSEPTISTHDRRKEATWLVAERDGKDCVLVFEVTHNTDRKWLDAALHYEQQSTRESGFMVRSFLIGQGYATVGRKPTARYSDKQRDAFFDEALASLRTMAVDEESPLRAKIDAVVALALGAPVA